MSTLQQIREGMGIAWDALVEGWRELFYRAGNAITRFKTRGAGGELLPGDKGEMSGRSSGWGILAAEIFDDDDRVVVRLEAPGMEPDELRLEVVDDVLIVHGEKKVQREHTKGYYHLSECAYGSFERAIALPDHVESDKASAQYRRGVLRVELPKSSSRRRRPIKVELR